MTIAGSKGFSSVSVKVESIYHHFGEYLLVIDVGLWALIGGVFENMPTMLAGCARSSP